MTPFFLFNFLSFLKTEKRYSEHTILAYKVDVDQFLDFCGIKTEEELIELNSFVIRGWIVDLLEREYTNRSVNRKLSSLRTLFKWLQKEGVINESPLSKTQGPKTEKRLPNFARVSEMSIDNLNEIFKDDFEGIRNRLIVEILYQTGIRLSELINLKLENVANDQIKVFGKRQKERIIPISEDLNLLIINYKLRKIELEVKTENLFCLNNGNKLYPKFVYRIINSYLGLVTNLDKCSPHVLRHTFATHMLNNGAGLETLKNLLGHASLSATQVYTHNSFTQLTNIYSQAHPRGHKKK
jgi:integrase/recombinase XerC